MQKRCSGWTESSREHAALVPRSLGLRLVVARSFARIHMQNLINFGVLPLRFEKPDEDDRLAPGDHLLADDLPRTLEGGREVPVAVDGNGLLVTLVHDLSARQLEILFAGSVLNWHAH
jgi:aconitate hydratase